MSVVISEIFYRIILYVVVVTQVIAQENAIKLSGTDLNRVGLVIKNGFYFLMWAARCIVETQNIPTSNNPKNSDISL